MLTLLGECDAASVCLERRSGRLESAVAEKGAGGRPASWFDLGVGYVLQEYNKVSRPTFLLLWVGCVAAVVFLAHAMKAQLHKIRQDNMCGCAEECSILLVCLSLLEFGQGKRAMGGAASCRLQVLKCPTMVEVDSNFLSSERVSVLQVPSDDDCIKTV